MRCWKWSSVLDERAKYQLQKPKVTTADSRQFGAVSWGIFPMNFSPRIWMILFHMSKNCQGSNLRLCRVTDFHQLLNRGTQKRFWYWTTRVLETKRIVTWIPGYELPRKSVRFTNTHCTCRKWESGEPYVAKVHGRCCLRGTVDARVNLHIFAKSVRHGTMWNTRLTSSIKMVHHATYQQNPW